MATEELAVWLGGVRVAVIARERGPEHSKTFTIEVRVGKDLTAQADGHSKKDASQKAAKEMYLLMSTDRSDLVAAEE